MLSRICAPAHLRFCVPVHRSMGPAWPLASRAVIIAVVSAKGGTGKTLLVMCLGASARPPVTLVDCDPQSTALSWARMAEAEGTPLSAQVVGLPGKDLRRRLGALNMSRSTTVILDTPPGDLAIITGALSVCDVALVPVRPTVTDVSRIWATLALADEASVPALVVLSQCRARTRLLEDSRSALLGGGARVSRVEIPDRQAIAAAFGGPVPLLLEDLGAELLDEMHKLTRARRRTA